MQKQPLKNIILTSALLTAMSFSSLTIASSIPRGTSADHRVKVVRYDPNNIVILKSRFGYQTQITFAPNESVQSISIGDSMAWQAVPSGNHLFIKPVTESNTNMTILTNLNNYNFQLDSTNEKISPTFKLQFTYPEGGFDQAGDRQDVASVNPQQLNWKYSFNGDKALAPQTVFDDGKMTFFEFKKDGMSKTPAIFIVDKERNETLVNYHVQGKYMIVHSVAKQFSLRNGSQVTFVYNEAQNRGV